MSAHTNPFRVHVRTNQDVRTSRTVYGEAAAIQAVYSFLGSLPTEATLLTVDVAIENRFGGYRHLWAVRRNVEAKWGITATNPASVEAKAIAKAAAYADAEVAGLAAAEVAAYGEATPSPADLVPEFSAAN